MAQSIFEQTASGLEETTSLEKLEARGTVRLALKRAGLDAVSVNAAQMFVVLDQVLPAELIARGVDGAERVCQELRAALAAALPSGADVADEDSESPEAVFRRLARR